jgi:serine/threonine protein kinase
VIVTDVARHLELVDIFPGLADDLISGLAFIHSAGVVHADIKPANVLLDMSDHYSLPRPVIRARFIDFSASFRSDADDSTANAGGTWEYMAPEQLRIQKELNTPTSASDVWSLGVTLLTLIVGGSPYAAACGDNQFMLREAIKTGDPLSFARAEPRARKRLNACQSFIDCCRQALKKDRDRRVSALAWKAWLDDQEFSI